MYTHEKYTKYTKYTKYKYTNLGCQRGVRFIEQRPHLGLELLPPRESALVICLLETELPCQFLVGRLLGIEVQPVEDCQRFLRVPMLEERVGVEERKDATTIVIRTCETLSFSRRCVFFFFLFVLFLGTHIKKRVQSVRECPHIEEESHSKFRLRLNSSWFRNSRSRHMLHLVTSRYISS